jgi:hypothetical protein
VYPRVYRRATSIINITSVHIRCLSTIGALSFTQHLTINKSYYYQLVDFDETLLIKNGSNKNNRKFVQQKRVNKRVVLNGV